jgi:hypothetical protein
MIAWHLPGTSSREHLINHLMAKKGFAEMECYGYACPSEAYLLPREWHYGQHRLTSTDTTKQDGHTIGAPTNGNSAEKRQLRAPPKQQLNTLQPNIRRKGKLGRAKRSPFQNQDLRPDFAALTKLPLTHQRIPSPDCRRGHLGGWIPAPIAVRQVTDLPSCFDEAMTHSPRRGASSGFPLR